MYFHEFSYSMVHLLKFFLVHFKNGPEYLTRGTAKSFIPLMRVFPCSLVSSSFLVLLRYSFLIFSFISACLMRPLPIFPSICKFLFLLRSYFLIDFVVRSLLSFVVFRFSSWEWHIFLCEIPSLCRQYISSLPVLGLYFWQTVWCHPCTIGCWFFLPICGVCIRLCFSQVCDWLASSLLQIVIEVDYSLKHAYSELPCN